MTAHIAPERLSGYLDGELGAEQRREVDEHLEKCGECMAHFEAVMSVKRRVQREASRLAAPAPLRRRIAGEIRNEFATRSGRPARAVPWWGAVAATAVTVVFAVAVTLRLSQPEPGVRLDAEITASHVRSLIGDRMTDVASSDQHTVKPWFSGKLDFSPPVRDFVEQGFPLLGGRVDYIGKRRVAVLVYRRRQHLIDVYIWPADDPAASGLQSRSIDGYQIEHVSSGGMELVGISDVNRDDLRQLMALMGRLPDKD